MNIANNALENCTSIKQVVELINDEFQTDATSETVAAAYAISGAEEAGYGIGDNEIAAQLDALREAGAKFEYASSLNLAIESVNN